MDYCNKIIVIGGGAAGLMAAHSAAFMGAEVTLLERNGVCGKKLRITGKGRCNVTNDCTLEEFLANVPTNPRFLYSALNRLSPQDVMAFFEYENGTTGEYITSTGEAPGTNRLEVACDMGKVVIEGNRMLFYKNEISEREFEKINTVPVGKPACEEIAVDTDFSGGEQHVGIFKNVVAAINDGAPLLAPLAEGIKGLTISNAIHLSGWTGETVDVKNFPDDRFYDILQEKIRNSTVVKQESKVVADTAGTY